MHPDAFRSMLPYPLDPFQVEAVEALWRDESVLVSVPTGAGKTLVAEYAARRSLQAGSCCLYTTPLKALSNQKFREFGVLLGDERVGLVTGDVVVRPEAPLLVMTTEILRNWLVAYPERVAGVSDVILDEAHYLGDEGRGSVWEETIIFLSAHIRLTALSATLPNAAEIAAWVSSIHRPMRVISHAGRPVPLIPYVSSPGLTPWRGRLASGHGDVPIMALLYDLRRMGMLPALVFRFSRAGCEVLADEAASVAWTTPGEQAEIAGFVDQAPKELAESPRTQHWLRLLITGVAPHHAGLLPPFKLLVEKLFQRGLLKLVFATETLAAGIHMPAKTVLLAELVKPSRLGDRLLSVSEFRQMTGRAGRRGLDKVGYAVIANPQRYRLQEVNNLLQGEPEPLVSTLKLSYSLVAGLTQRWSDCEIQRILARSLAQFQRGRETDGLKGRLVEVEGLLSEALSGPATADAWLTARSGPVPGLLAEKGFLEREIARHSQGPWPVFQAMRRLLEEAGFMSDGRLTRLGRRLAVLRGEQELLSVLALDELATLKGAEVAALVSALVADSHHAPEAIQGPLQPVFDHLGYLAKRLNRLQEHHGLHQGACRLDRAYVPAVLAWAEGQSWREVVRRFDEGELQWHLRQVLDRLHQLARMPELTDNQAELLAKAIRLIDRGVVRLVL